MGTLFEDLRSPDAYPAPRPSAVEVRETHISSVYLLEQDVFKIKKPVDFGFLDFTTFEKRRAACEAEVRLNRRLSPDVYLGVVPVTRTPDGRHHTGPGAPGEIVDHAVHMRRLSDDERADVLLAKGALARPEIDRIATAIARFHEACRSDDETATFGTVESIQANVVENLVQTRSVLEHYLSTAEAQEIETYQLGVLARDRDLFARRVRQGRVRDGHGDLRLEHAYLHADGRLSLLDCIEFNDRFRYADVACDIAFLTMDLAHHRRVDLAEHLLASYARESNDFDLYSVVDFYESYRAYVRAKIATFLAENRDAPHDLRARAAEEARRHFLLALSAHRAPALRPCVIAVGGVIAAGKSTLADWISAELAAPIVEADRTRKSMIGVAATTKVHDGVFAGAYDKGFTEKVYSEVMRRASVVLASGRPVIIDASFRSPTMRLAAQAVSKQRGAPFYFIECRAPAEVCKERLRERERQPGTVSDGRLAIFDDFVKEWQPVTELSPGEHIVVNTACAPADTHATVRAHIATWPRGLSG